MATSQALNSEVPASSVDQDLRPKLHTSKEMIQPEPSRDILQLLSGRDTPQRSQRIEPLSELSFLFPEQQDSLAMEALALLMVSRNHRKLNELLVDRIVEDNIKLAICRYFINGRFELNGTIGTILTDIIKQNGKQNDQLKSFNTEPELSPVTRQPKSVVGKEIEFQQIPREHLEGGDW